MSSRNRWQFSLLSLVVATSLAGVAFGIVRAFGAAPLFLLGFLAPFLMLGVVVAVPESRRFLAYHGRNFGLYLVFFTPTLFFLVVGVTAAHIDGNVPIPVALIGLCVVLLGMAIGMCAAMPVAVLFEKWTSRKRRLHEDRIRSIVYR